MTTAMTLTEQWLGTPPLSRGEPLSIPRDYIPTPESLHALHHLDLEVFSGPLDLLLLLIRRHKIDVFDIPMAFICRQYLDCLAMAQELNLDIAAEFMYMAAELLHIKSRMLLPRPKDVAEQEEEADPRATLVQRLLQYQRYQDASMELDTRPRLDWDIFCRASDPLLSEPANHTLKNMDVFVLASSLRQLLQNQQPPKAHQVLIEFISLKQRMRYLLECTDTAENCIFKDLLPENSSRLHCIVSFLAVLELVRLKLLKVSQSENVMTLPLVNIAEEFHDTQTAAIEQTKPSEMLHTSQVVLGPLLLNKSFDDLQSAYEKLSAFQDEFGG